jgi:hypothetical protein
MPEVFGLGPEAFNPCGKTNTAATDKSHQHNLESAAQLPTMSQADKHLDAAQMRALATGLRWPEHRAGTVL